MCTTSSRLNWWFAAIIYDSSGLTKGKQTPRVCVRDKFDIVTFQFWHPDGLFACNRRKEETFDWNSGRFAGRILLFTFRRDRANPREIIEVFDLAPLHLSAPYVYVEISYPIGKHRAAWLLARIKYFANISTCMYCTFRLVVQTNLQPATLTTSIDSAYLDNFRYKNIGTFCHCSRFLSPEFQKLSHCENINNFRFVISCSLCLSLSIFFVFPIHLHFSP